MPLILKTLVGRSFNLPLISLPEEFGPIIYLSNSSSDFAISSPDFKNLS